MAFPTSPNLGDQHVVNQQTYEWNGAAWDTIYVPSSVVYDKTQYEAVGGETTYNIVYVPGYIDIFNDGNKLIDGVDFTAVDGSTVNFTNALVELDKLTFQVWSMSEVLPKAGIYNKTQFVATGGEVSYTINYKPGYIDIFNNGTKLVDGTDFTASNGTNVDFSSALSASDELTFQVWTVTDLGATTGSSTSIDTTNFNNILNASDDTVQKALDKLDNTDFSRLSTTNTFTAPQIGAITTDNDLSFDLSLTNNFSCTPVANGTLDFTNISSGQSGNILLDNTGGYTISKAGSVKCDSNFLTNVSTAGIYWVSYFSNGTNVFVVTSSELT